MTKLLNNVPAWQEITRSSQYAYIPDAVETVNPGAIDTLLSNLERHPAALTEAGTVLWYILRDMLNRTDVTPVTEGSIHSWLKPFGARVTAIGQVDIISAEYATRTVVGLADIITEMGVPYFVRCSTAVLFGHTTRPYSWMEHYTKTQELWLPGDAL